MILCHTSSSWAFWGRFPIWAHCLLILLKLYSRKIDQSLVWELRFRKLHSEAKKRKKNFSMNEYEYSLQTEFWVWIFFLIFAIHIATEREHGSREWKLPLHLPKLSPPFPWYFQKPSQCLVLDRSQLLCFNELKDFSNHKMT